MSIEEKSRTNANSESNCKDEPLSKLLEQIKKREPTYIGKANAYKENEDHPYLQLCAVQSILSTVQMALQGLGYAYPHATIGDLQKAGICTLDDIQSSVNIAERLLPLDEMGTYADLWEHLNE